MLYMLFGRLLYSSNIIFEKERLHEIILQDINWKIQYKIIPLKEFNNLALSDQTEIYESLKSEKCYSSLQNVREENNECTIKNNKTLEYVTKLENAQKSQFFGFMVILIMLTLCIVLLMIVIYMQCVLKVVY